MVALNAPEEGIRAVATRLEASTSQEDVAAGSGKFNRVRAAAAAFTSDSAKPGPCGEAAPPAAQLTRVPSAVSRVKAAAAALEAAYGGGGSGGSTPRGSDSASSVSAALARFRQINEEAASRPPPVPLRHSASLSAAPADPAARSAAPSAPRDPAKAPLTRDRKSVV